MRTTDTAAGRRVIEIEEDALLRALWAIAAAGVAAMLVVSDRWTLAVVAAGAAAVLAWMSHQSSEVRRDLRVPIDAAWAAAFASVHALGLVCDLSRTRRGITEGHVVAHDARVRLESHPGGITRLRVRFGRLGLPDDRRRAALLAERIVADLETRARI